MPNLYLKPEEKITLNKYDLLDTTDITDIKVNRLSKKRDEKILEEFIKPKDVVHLLYFAVPTNTTYIIQQFHIIIKFYIFNSATTLPLLCQFVFFIWCFFSISNTFNSSIINEFL